MLQIMQETAATTPSPTTTSFAGLLAALAAPASSAAGRPSAWNDDDLASDVATLSYEHALRSHARYKPSEPDGWPFPKAPGPIAAPDEAVPNGKAAIPSAASARNVDWSADEPIPFGHGLPTAVEQNRKRASVTIRMSAAECAQLHQRAAEAGLTVSAYLRSCTFEAEALRAEVKQTLAQLRSAAPAQKSTAPAEKPSPPAPARRSWFGWLAWLLPPWRSSPRAALAYSTSPSAQPKP